MNDIVASATDRNQHYPISNLISSLHPFKSFLYLGRSIKNGLRQQLEAWGNYGYDNWWRYLRDETKPARDFESLEIGETAVRTITIAKWRVFFFALVSGDFNQLHFDPEFASQTRFRNTIGHGLIVAGAVSAILGMDVPGLGTYYISQSWSFKRPMKIGSEVVIRVKITNLDYKKRRVTLLTEALDKDKVVATGEAVAGIDEYPYETRH